MNINKSPAHGNENAESARYLKGIRENDHQIIDEIYRKFSGSIISLVHQNNGTTADARDIFQDVMISIFRQANNGLELKCSFNTFLYLACKKRWISYAQSKYRSKTSYGDDNVGNVFSINEEVNHFLKEDEKFKLMMEKVKMMNEGCRDVIELSWKRGEDGNYMSWMEIAQILEVSYAYVRKKASECKSRLIDLVRKDVRFRELL
ncbi:MAG: sigma-70 family RNA polymerase sigma factor [Saprospiraceae bacterium]|nr:sigma-70 family RNA polymerase sigma factor [Saprospiraceae bacterium]